MMKKRSPFRSRPGFSLIEVLMVTALLSICAAGATRIWSLCYSLNDKARQMQAGKQVLEQEVERVRRLNWTGLPEQASFATRYCYDSGGNPVGTSSVTRGFVAYIKVETLDSEALKLAGTPTRDTTGGTSRSLRRVTVVVEPTGVSASTTSYTAQAITYLTLGGP
jgi:prepilin-type N-terminal cleavage/methylation domain-containing protein